MWPGTFIDEASSSVRGAPLWSDYINAGATSIFLWLRRKILWTLLRYVAFFAECVCKGHAVIHYRTEDVCGSCSLPQRLPNGLRRKDTRHEQAFWDGNMILETARKEPQPSRNRLRSHRSCRCSRFNQPSRNAHTPKYTSHIYARHDAISKRASRAGSLR
jgi:hypothetical protein